MYLFLSILIIIVCALLVLVVLVQNSKGGGLSSSFGASNQIMGVKKTGDFLEKSTWGLAIALLVLSLASSAFINREDAGVQTESAIKEQIDNAQEPAQQEAPLPTGGQEQPATPPTGN
ncbi:MAG: preprotein translocase subunit SecG [Bacteroidia bacterium]